MSTTGIVRTKSGRDDLIESIAVALMSATNSRGLRVIIRDPLRYATLIADEQLAANRPDRSGRPTLTVIEH